GVGGREKPPKEDGELFPTGAGNGVGGAKPGTKAFSQLLQSEIADRMTVGVVDLFEAIEVEANDRRKIAIARGGGQRLFHAVGQEQPIGQSSKSIMVGLVHQPFVELLALGHVLSKGKAGLRSLKQNAVRSRVDLNAGAVFFPMRPRTGDEGGLTLALEALVKIGSLLGREDVANGHREEFSLRIPVMENGGAVDLEEDVRIQIGDPHRKWIAVKE